MLEAINDRLTFTFPEVHAAARLSVTFQRTLRIPDDGRSYPLPPGLGLFPVRHVDDFKGKVPDAWSKHGGVMMPMYQSEAMWLQFTSSHVPGHGSYGGVPYPFAVRVATGKRSAVTGKQWTAYLREGDYLVIPTQPWLDGYVVEGGQVRQFVAAPLGLGVTAEEQITGKAEFGGLQIEAVPMSAAAFLRRWPALPPQPVLAWNNRPGARRGMMKSSVSKGVFSDDGDTNYSATMDSLQLECCAAAPAAAASFSADRSRIGDSLRSVPTAVSDMGLAPGGRMQQQVHEDPYEFSDWEKKGSRCFVHLLNSMAWQSVTGAQPPTAPRTAADYSRYGLPWYDHYVDGAKVATGTSKTKGLKGIAELAPGLLPENSSVVVSSVLSVGKVRDGSWA